MPSPIAHTLGAYAGLVLIKPDLISTKESRRMTFGLAAIFGSLADADFLVAQFTTNPTLQHHYFSHSIPFAFFIGFLSYLILILFRTAEPIKKAGLITVAYLSHLLLDFFTQDGGRPFGIPLLWPLTHKHFMSPVVIFYSIHRGGWEDYLSAHNLIGICIEFVVMGTVAYLAVRRAKRINRALPEAAMPADRNLSFKNVDLH
jgi:inner membrane protein